MIKAIENETLQTYLMETGFCEHEVSVTDVDTESGIGRQFEFHARLLHSPT